MSTNSNSVTDNPVAMPLIGDFLDHSRVMIDLEVSSRKRLFEQMAKLLSFADNDAQDSRHTALDLDAVLQILNKREKLGCTAIGKGIALPHGRIDGLDEPRMAVARLKHEINYDAEDGMPIWLAVCLLVPSEETETHLQLLAALAARFSISNFLEQLKNARSAMELSEILISGSTAG